MKASRESVAYRLDAASSPNQLDTSRFEAPERKKPTQTERREPVGRQPASKQGHKSPDTAKKTKKGTHIRQRIRLVTPARLFCAVFVAAVCVLPDLFADDADRQDA